MSLASTSASRGQKPLAFGLKGKPPSASSGESRYPLRPTPSRLLASSRAASSQPLPRLPRTSVDDAAAELALLRDDWVIKPDPATAVAAPNAPEPLAVQTADLLAPPPPPPTPLSAHLVRICLIVSSLNGEERVHLCAFSVEDVTDAGTTNIVQSLYYKAYTAGLHRAGAEHQPIIDGLQSHIAVCVTRLDHTSASLASTSAELASKMADLARMTAERDAAFAEHARLRQELASAERLAAVRDAMLTPAGGVSNKQQPKKRKKKKKDDQPAVAGSSADAAAHLHAAPAHDANNISNASHTAHAAVAALAVPQQQLAPATHPAATPASVAPPPSTVSASVAPAPVASSSAAVHSAVEHVPTGWDLNVAASRARQCARDTVAFVAEARLRRGYRPKTRARASAPAAQDADDGTWQKVEKKNKRRKRIVKKKAPAKGGESGRPPPRAVSPQTMEPQAAMQRSPGSVEEQPVAPVDAPPAAQPAAATPTTAATTFASTSGGVATIALAAPAAPAAPSITSAAAPTAYVPPPRRTGIMPFADAIRATGMEPFYNAMLNSVHAHMAHFGMHLAAAAYGTRLPPSFSPPACATHAIAVAAAAPNPAINGV